MHHVRTRQLEATALGKTVERGTQTEFNPVNQITIPTNVYCFPGGECRSHVEEVRRVEERADGCYQEETFVYVLCTATRTMK